MSEAVKVIVRCRPRNEKEEKLKCQKIVRIEECKVFLENPADKKAPEKQFNFDNAYDGEASNEVIYNDICYSLVESVLEGYNASIFAYGQTGCGKSHTMQGPTLSKLVDGQEIDTSDNQAAKNYGIISFSFEHLFEAIQTTHDVRYLVVVSYLEIYNENIRDLLSNDPCNNLKLKENPLEGVIVENLSRHPVHSREQCEQLLLYGTKNRKVGATLMNAGSSRSHSIFIINVEQISKGQGDNSEDVSIRKGKLNLIDLAGSERANKTGATGERMKEATKINLSLSALGNVISALVDGKTKHVPYRDSKLTRLLQDSLGGNTKTLMVACISPADYNYEETLSTLRYAARAKNITNKPKINEDPKDAMLREYQAEINMLRKLLEQSGNSVNATIPVDYNHNNDIQEQIRAEKEKIEKEYELKAQQLRVEHDQHKREKEDMIHSMEKLKKEYEEKLKEVTESMKNTHSQKTENITSNNESDIKIIDRIKTIKDILIGGERANDTQLKEKRFKKKLAAQKKLNALNSILNRIEQSEDRDLLQTHYSDIHQEILAKTELLKHQRQKIRSLEREIVDIQGEFQLDRADYLETIRRLEKRNKFYEQFFEKISPILKRDGKVWNIDYIKSESIWNDDLKKWKIPENLLMHVKLPPATPKPNSTDSSKSRENTSSTAPARLECLIDSYDSDENSDKEKQKDVDIAMTYFRPKRIEKLIHDSRAWKNDLTQKAFSLPKNSFDETILNKTWFAGSNYFKSQNNPWNLNLNANPTKPVW
ncbi:hypothetical protein PVAND_011656 [Polypedilum vanderplanki]|uniref:Kinesin-like protein n=1 Tax=Polypedilum vanderplanki TaxID=319348 RepID=A0A9J6CK52_POLVA|nr:hypothetical protein PVAND_011656 [Polypedilum vanderplanki]